MHIADGVLPVSLCMGGYVLAVAGSAYGSRRLQPEDVPRMGILAAATFVASTVHFPVAGTSLHFGLFGLLGVLLGKRALPVSLAVLLVQAFLFQHGGFLTLGVNTVNMGLGAMAAVALWRLQWIPPAPRAAVAGFAGMFVPALLVVLEFQVAGYGRSLVLLLGAYAALAAVEGAFTGLVVSFLMKARPEMFRASVASASLGASAAAVPAVLESSARQEL